MIPLLNCAQTYTTKKKEWRFSSAPSRRWCTIHVSHSISVPYTHVQLVIGRGLLMCKKMKGQLVHLPTSIDSFILSWSCIKNVLGQQLTTAALRSWVSFVIVSYRWSIDIALPIDSDCLEMQSLGQSDASFGFLDAWGVIFALAIRVVLNYHQGSVHSLYTVLTSRHTSAGMGGCLGLGYWILYHGCNILTNQIDL